MFGYFESQSELAGNKEELIGESIAVYAPPETLGQMSSENPVAYNTTQHSPHVAGDGETLFFRANVVFAADMEYYYEHGQLPGRDPGHEQEYLD